MSCPQINGQIEIEWYLACVEDVPGRQLDQDVEEQLLGQTDPAHAHSLTGTGYWSPHLEPDFGVNVPWWISFLTKLLNYQAMRGPVLEVLHIRTVMSNLPSYHC